MTLICFHKTACKGFPSLCEGASAPGISMPNPADAEGDRSPGVFTPKGVVAPGFIPNPADAEGDRSPGVFTPKGAIAPGFLPNRADAKGDRSPGVFTPKGVIAPGFIPNPADAEGDMFPGHLTETQLEFLADADGVAIRRNIMLESDVNSQLGNRTRYRRERDPSEYFCEGS
ncbi:hypothetical protein BD410DRAFT_809517 [Rickenella mellea]|uniref:Uncharacterized protein n=1 Tax=Rickenella mellea TaxID=50990 RepID=A0A4Y7PHH4_9AGAM|nr:hypothetical protein BD410DRAFT_809517 [Rickenella mellea]